MTKTAFLCAVLPVVSLPANLLDFSNLKRQLLKLTKSCSELIEFLFGGRLNWPHKDNSKNKDNSPRGSSLQSQSGPNSDWTLLPSCWLTPQPQRQRVSPLLAALDDLNEKKNTASLEVPVWCFCFLFFLLSLVI